MNDHEILADDGDALLEIQAAIDRLTDVVFEEWAEDGLTPEDEAVRDMLVDARPLIAELDALWTHLRRSLGR